MRISDWSSDVCSSDLRRHAAALAIGAANGVARRLGGNHDDVDVGTGLNLAVVHVEAVSKRQGRTGLDVAKIGRASGRERVCQYVYISVVAVSLKKKEYRLSEMHVSCNTT